MFAQEVSVDSISRVLNGMGIQVSTELPKALFTAPEQKLGECIYRCTHHGDLTFVLWNDPAGFQLSQHIHEAHTQRSRVLAGKFRMILEGVARTADLNESYYIPPGTHHAGEALTDCVVLDVFQPRRLDLKGIEVPLSGDGDSNVGHTSRGTAWGAGASIYAAMRHGPDGGQFLDPYFLPDLFFDIQGKKTIDIGCGASYWAIEAVKRGGAHSVAAVDLQESMVRISETAVREARLENQIRVCVGDAACLSDPDNSFEKAMSINVGCNLPSASFAAHFREMFRVLSPGSTAVVTAPANFDVVFSNGVVPVEQNMRDIEATLAAIGFTTDSQTVISHLNSLKNIYRATFYESGGAIKLFRGEAELKSGTPIWRKIPGQAVPNVYHHEDEYLAVAKTTGFQMLRIHRAAFEHEAQRAAYNILRPRELLGPEYIGKSPFISLLLRKPAEAD